MNVIEVVLAILWTSLIALQFYRLGFRHGLEELERQYEQKKDGTR